MSQSELNSKFRDKLRDYSSDIDQDQLWLAIADDVPTKKKKPKGIFWFWGLASLFLIGLFGTYVFQVSEFSSEKDVVNSDFTYSKNDHKLALDNNAESEKISKSIQLLESEVVRNTMQKDIAVLSNAERKNEANSIQVISEPKNEELYARHTSDYRFKDQNTTVNKQEATEKEKYESSRVLNAETSIKNTFATGFRKSISPIEYVQIPKLLEMMQIPERERPIIASLYKSKNRIKPIKMPSHIIQLNYSAGSYEVTQKLVVDKSLLVDDGDAYFSQGIDMKYGHFITSKIYAVASLNYDVNYKHFQATIKRDTIVPSSVGEQLLATYIYEDGQIDNISGVPEVLASFTRSVSNLNTFKSLNLGLGLGYLIKMKGVRIHIEGQMSRSIYTDRSGFVILNKKQRISNLSSISELYSSETNYNTQMEIGAIFPIYKRAYLVTGVQYQKGLTNQIISLRGSEYYSSLNGIFGVRLHW